jgi:hypothetical protein
VVDSPFRTPRHRAPLAPAVASASPFTLYTDREAFRAAANPDRLDEKESLAVACDVDERASVGVESQELEG